MRPKALGVCSVTFHSNVWPRKLTFLKALVAGGTRVGHDEVLPPFGHFLYVQLAHRCLLAPVWLLMTIALWKGLGMSIAEINSKHNCLSRSSLQQVKFPHALQEKKQPRWPRDKLLRIPICYGRKADQNNKKSNPRMSILTSRQIINVGESWVKGKPPCMVNGNGHWQQLLERTASQCQKKKKKTFQKTKPRILISHT